MQLALVTEADTHSPCTGETCELDRSFDLKVLRLGTVLAQSSFVAYPDLPGRLGKFEFVIVEKANPGTLSNASGTVVIFRGAQKLQLGEEVLAFLIAREMGHVIGGHHDENSATGILFSVLASVFMPVSNIIGGSAAVTQSASASAASTAATSAASFIGSRITIDSYKSDQMRAADVIAMELLNTMGWDRKDIADALITATRVMGNDNWSKDLRASAENAVRLAEAQNSATALHIAGADSSKTVIKTGLH